MPRGAKRDIQATAEAHFADKRSFVSTNGQRFLRGEDISAARQRCMDRARIGHGRVHVRCQVCGMTPHEEYAEMDHKLAKGRGGDDSDENLQAICRSCHRAKHVQVRFGVGAK